MLWMQQYAMGRYLIYHPEVDSAFSYVADGSEGNPIETAALYPKVDSTRWHMKSIGDYLPLMAGMA